MYWQGQANTAVNGNVFCTGWRYDDPGYCTAFCSGGSTPSGGGRSAGLASQVPSELRFGTTDVEQAKAELAARWNSLTNDVKSALASGGANILIGVGTGTVAVVLIRIAGAIASWTPTGAVIYGSITVGMIIATIVEWITGYNDLKR